MPKIATICDDYRVEMFKEEFRKAGISFLCEKFTPNTSMFTTISDQEIIKPIVDRVTQYFIDLKNKSNAKTS